MKPRAAHEIAQDMVLADEPVTADDPTGDHRSRVASEKRSRMRERLIVATMDAYLAVDPSRHPVIDDVIRIAEVSRGTFYKYFDALDEVLAEIGQRTADEMLGTYEQVYGPLDDAAIRVAAGPVMALARAAMEPRHAAFISRVDFIDFLDSADPRRRQVETSLSEARAQGVLAFEALDAAVDVVIGCSVEGARRVLHHRMLDGAYIRELSTMVMRALGMPREQAADAVSGAWTRLQHCADQLHWWKPVSVA